MSDNNFDISVRRIAYQSRWFLNASRYALLNNVNNTEAFGTHRRSAVELIEDSLNQQLPTIRDPHPTEPDRQIVNLPETAAAREKQEQIQKAFAEWAWADSQRSRRLAAIYNAKFNSRVTRQFDGSHLTLPGSNRNIKLRPSQKAAIWRILQSPTTLLAHVVGGGKSFVMIGAAMELKRLKLARKPLFAVPNHLVDQFAKEFLRLYPKANLLVVGRDEVGKDRNILMAKIATGDWDGVVCSHSSFNRLPVRQETELAFEATELKQIEDALLAEQEGAGDRRIVKTLERAKRKFEARMEELKEKVRHDNSICFEDLGIDGICHVMKHIILRTSTTPPRCRWPVSINATPAGPATCFSNAAGSYRSRVAAWFLPPEPLSPIPWPSFTPSCVTWLRTFSTSTDSQFSMTGPRLLGKPLPAWNWPPKASVTGSTLDSQFTNIPEMMSLTATFADIKTHEKLNLDRPAIHGGKPEIVIIPPTEALRTFVDQLGSRAEAVRSGSVDPHTDNMLAITTDGRKAALDMRLIHPNLVPGEETKASAAAKCIAAIWRETEAQKGAQLVFCDLATPRSSGFNVYAQVRTHLIQQGIPEREIAFIHDFESDASKLQLYRDVNRGTIRVLFGSTEKLGCGTNIQERLAALHHLDSPWRPCDIEQREGRILRQGNRFKEVRILRYVTEASFDAYMWQILESKIRFVTQFMSGESSVRTAEDVDSAVLSYAEIKALASGNPKILEKAAVDNEVQKLSLLEKAWLNSRYSHQMELHACGEKIARLQKHQTNLQADLALRQDTSGDKFTLTLGGQTFTERKAAGFEILRLAQHHVPRLNHNDTREIGSIVGFKIQLRRAFFDKQQASVEIVGQALYETELGESPLGVIASLENQLRRMEEKLAAAAVAQAEATERLARLQQSLGGGFQHAARLAQLRKKQAALNEELQSSKGETMAVGEAAAAD